ncbi:IS1595 family transposase [Leisingera sp. MMG026]|uniref:IS1595 family transposase n=1 Tax=Leisingera sp. MMG026 TaxID=2909982 RepID=UPI001F00DB08|nr:IS1595 family transposase [Leisingera sp. MMG026]MCF6433150.1 IS1595 family transposase [Leisingera sp. MMG026]
MQNFLLSPEARDLPPIEVATMSEAQAYDMFCKIRWARTNGKPICPRCSSREYYPLTRRRKFKCKHCHHQFSVTSGSLFAGRKLAFRVLLYAISLFVGAGKGYSAIQLSHGIGVQYKTAFVLLHKIREALSDFQSSVEELVDEVEVDGAYFGGYVKPKNERKRRLDRRRKQYTSGKRLVVAVARERSGRTFATVAKREADAVLSIMSKVHGDATVFADEAAAWDDFHIWFLTYRINHAVSYADDGTSTNQAESFFSRIRRAEIGIYHHIAGAYLSAYAGELAWREDNRRVGSRSRLEFALSLALLHPVSRTWKGYWQRRSAV